MKRRILSIITALALCLSLCPTWAFAVEGEPDTGLCDHHPEHTEDCGYTAPTEGQPCGHEHTAECYTLGVLPDADSGNPYEVGGDTENLLDCHHSHDSECGYVEADPGASCGYVCRICPIEDLIAALPEQVTEDNADDVRAQLDHILDLYRELDEGEQEEIDLSRIYALQGALDAANDPMPLAAGTVNNFLNFCTEYSTTISPAEGSGYKWDDATKTLTLTDFHQVVSVSFGIILPGGSTLVLEGENTIQLGDNPCVGVDCYGSLALAGDGTLAVTSGSGASPEYGAIRARKVGNRLTFDNYICKDLSYKTVEFTIQKTLYHCLSDKSEQNILSSIAPVAKVEKTDEDPFYVASLINAFAEEYSGATITLLRDASFPRVSSIRGDFTFCTDGKKVDFDTQGTGLEIADGVFHMNGDLTSSRELFTVIDGGTLILEQGNFSGNTIVTLDGGALEIPDGADVKLNATATPLYITSGTATLRGGSFYSSFLLGSVIFISDACDLTADKLLAPGYCYAKDGVTQELSTMSTKKVVGNGATFSVRKCTDHKEVNSWTIMETTHCKTCVYCKTKILEEAHTYNSESDTTCTVCGYAGHIHSFGAWQTSDTNGIRTITRGCIHCDTQNQTITYTPVISVPYNHTGTVSLEQKIKTVGIDSLTYKWENYINSINSWSQVFTSSFTPPAAGQSKKYRATITTSGIDAPQLEFTLTRELCHHENMAWTQVDNSNHSGTCPDCSEEVTAAHTFDENGNCVCGATLAVTLTNAEGLIYKGDEHKPGVSVAVNDKTLTENTDYTVSYTDNINAGENTATVTVTGTDTGWTVTKTFSIGKATPTIAWNPIDVETIYTGQPADVKPVVTLVNGETYSGEIHYSWYGVADSLILPTDAGSYGGVKASIPEQDNYNAAITEIGLNLHIDYADQAAPAAPTAEDANIKDNSITLTAIENAEYKMGDGEWQESPTFTGLEPNQAYTFYARLKADDNHNASPSSEGTSITTRKAMLENASVTITGTYTYTGAAIVPEAGNVEVVLNGTKIDSDQYTISASNNINAGVGKATLTVTATETGNYSGSVSSTFTIAPATLTIKANDQTITYGGSIATGTDQVTSAGLVGGDTLESVTLKASSDQVAVADKTITPSAAVIKRGGEDVTANYNITYQPGALTINKSQPTIAFAGSYNPGKTYDSQTIPNPTADNLIITGANFSDVTFEWSATPKDAGTYTLTAKIAETNNTEAAQTDPLTVTISKATLTITGATVASKPYDGADTATVSGVTFTGLVNGETLALGTDYTATGTFADANAGEDKSVTVTVTLADTAKANNYTLASTSVNTTGTITKADPVVTDVSVSSPDPIYESVSLNNITLTHGVGDTAGTVALNPSQTLTVGTKGYAWTFTPDDTNNYSTATGTISLTVAVDALQSIAVTTPPSKTAYTYGESFDKAGMVITATYASGATKVVTGEVQISPAELTVTTTALTITYQGKTVTQAITVSPKEVTNPTIGLSPSSFVYDGTEKKPAVTVKDGEKMIPADEYTVEYSNNTNVGTTATVTITDKTGGNYTVSGTKTFTITAKPLTGAKVEVTGTFTYTGNALTPAPTVTLDGKTLTTGTDYTVAYTDNTNAGTAKITVTGTGNYSGTAQGTFTIGRADLTVDGTGTASGTYGDKLSELAVSGLTAKLGATEISGTWKLTGDTVPNVGDSGEYTATFTPATGADNYNALTAKVTLNIAKADYSGTTTASTSAKFGATGTYDLSALLPDGATAGTAATDSGIFEGTPEASGKTLTYTLKAGAAVSSTGTITVPVTSTNYLSFRIFSIRHNSD